MDYSKNNQELILPSGIRRITFIISLGKNIPIHNIECQYFGTLCYYSAEYFIEKSVNHIDIEIPAIDDSFFERYYVKGEYAKVTGDTITWKGETFIKRE